MNPAEGARTQITFSRLLDELEETMNFRLTYNGELMARGGGLPHKHAIRKRFHQQLKRMWDIHPQLQAWKRPMSAPAIPLGPDAAGTPQWAPNPDSRHDYMAKTYLRGKFSYVPIATEDKQAIATLDILFLRSGIPGRATGAGDLDGRLKTLIDALKIPDKSNANDIEVPDADETPFYCLMEDDKLVGNISVVTDTLLEPTPSSHGYHDTHDARVIIAVSLRTYANPASLGMVWT